VVLYKVWGYGGTEMKKKESVKLYKVLNGTKAKDGGKFDYKDYLPKENKKGKFLPTINIKENDICSKGYHLTKDYTQWLHGGSVVYEVEAKNIVAWEEDKCVCDSFRFIKKIETNTGKENTGFYNSGNYNSGNRNSGDSNSGFCNSGFCNSGNRNSGHYNSGHYNSGHWNSGNWNSGNWNSGNRNSGNRNSGHYNSGNYNSGNRNSGDCNSGHYNSGHYNSGHWNSGNWNSGYFNTDEPKVRIFGKETNLQREDINFPYYFYFDLNVWIKTDSMTDKEKKEFFWYKTTEGYLRKIGYKEAWKISFDKAEKEDVAKTLKLPNFDYAIFKKITGITKKMIQDKLK
jgi:hypothetical protein